MKKENVYFAGLVAIMAVFTACSSTTTTTTGSDSTSTNTMVMNPGDSAVTTTTTTTVVHHPYSGNFAPQPNVQYLDLSTHKQVTVRIDTALGRVVNAQTDQPINLFVDPVKHDTIYGQTGTVVNHYIIQDASGYRVDTVRINVK